MMLALAGVALVGLDPVAAAPKNQVGPRALEGVQVVRDLNDLPRVVTARREAARDVITESPAGAQGE